MPSQRPDPHERLSQRRCPPLPKSASNGLRPAHDAMAKVSDAENEVDLDALLEAIRRHWVRQKGRAKAARGRVRQVARSPVTGACARSPRPSATPWRASPSTASSSPASPPSA